MTLLRASIVVAFLLSAASTAALDPWTVQDTTMEAAFVLTLAADWAQTRSLDDFEEMNPILGRHPSTGKIDGWFAGTALLHAGVARLLPSRWRTVWQATWIGAELATVAGNYAVGVRINF